MHIFANLVTEDIKERALASTPVEALFCKQYVDDVTSAVSKNEVETLWTIRIQSYLQFNSRKNVKRINACHFWIQLLNELIQPRTLVILFARKEQSTEN